MGHAQHGSCTLSARFLANIGAYTPPAPVLHVLSHVHAVQDRDEPPEGPRLGASKRVAGCVFANVAAERQLPSLTGFRLMRRATEVRQAAAAMQLTEREWAPDPRQLLMRPPTQLVLPLAGYRCDEPGWSGWQA